MTGFIFSSQLALYHHLCGYARVVCTCLPQGIVPFHAMVAGQGIHNGVLEGMPHMQCAGDIRRWDHDAIAVAIVIFTG